MELVGYPFSHPTAEGSIPGSPPRMSRHYLPMAGISHRSQPRWLGTKKTAAAEAIISVDQATLTYDIHKKDRI